MQCGSEDTRAAALVHNEHSCRRQPSWEGLLSCQAEEGANSPAESALIVLQNQPLPELASRKQTVMTSRAAHRWTLPREMGARRRGHSPKEVEIVRGRPILQKVYSASQRCVRRAHHFFQTASWLALGAAQSQAWMTVLFWACVAPTLHCSRLHDSNDTNRKPPLVAAPACP